MHASDLVAWAFFAGLFLFRGALLAVVIYMIVAVIRGLLRPAEPGAAASSGTTLAPGKPSFDD
jgi:hypothetical protein